MKVYLVRHGETEYNKNHLVQGHTNIPLNETGIMQAKEAAKHLVGVKLDAAYSSTMDRAHDTCRYMLDNSGHENLNITRDERVIEKHYGKFEEATYEAWYKAQDESDLDTVEKDDSIVARMENFLKEKYNEHKDETIIVVCHGACIRIFLDGNNLRPNKDFIKNTAVNILNYDGEKFELEAYNL